MWRKSMTLGCREGIRYIPSDCVYGPKSHLEPELPSDDWRHLVGRD